MPQFLLQSMDTNPAWSCTRPAFLVFSGITLIKWTGKLELIFCSIYGPETLVRAAIPIIVIGWIILILKTTHSLAFARLALSKRVLGRLNAVRAS